MEVVIGVATAHLRPRRCKHLSPSTLNAKNHFIAELQPSPFLPSRQLLPHLSSSSSSSRRAQRLLTVSPSVVSVVKTENDRFPTGVMVTETKQPCSSVRLSIEVSPAICRECYNKVLHEFSKQVKVLCKSWILLVRSLPVHNKVPVV